MTKRKMLRKRLDMAKRSFRKELDELAPFIRPVRIEEYESRGRWVGNVSVDTPETAEEYKVAAE